MIHDYLFVFLFGICTCFLASTVAHEAIVGGIIVNEIHQFPYQVSVQVYGHVHCHVCGGGILGNRFILTAAHCVVNKTLSLLRSKHIYVLAGTRSLNRTRPPAVTVRVEEVFFPKEFHPTVEFNHGDIAVLKLVDSLELEHHPVLKKLELPRHYEDDSAAATIAGFGWNQYPRVVNGSVGAYDGHLRFIRAIILPNEQCNTFYPHGAFQDDRHLCALSVGFSRNTGVCTGDTGSPLTDIDDKIVFGVLSRTPPLCKEGPPALYTRVTYYLGMIHDVMEHGRDPQMISLRT